MKVQFIRAAEPSEACNGYRMLGDVHETLSVVGLEYWVACLRSAGKEGCPLLQIDVT
jgi:hypothetical protein